MINQALINSVKNRDQKAFEEMYNGCIGYVYAIVLRYVQNESDYQDVIQEIFARIFLSIESFDENKGEFKYWIRRITINQCIKLYRKNSKSFVDINLDDAKQIPDNSENEILSISRDDIMLYLSNMPEGYKQIFMLNVIDEYSHKEIAEMMRISPETSRSQLHRAKNWLRNNLSDNNIKLLVGEYNSN